MTSSLFPAGSYECQYTRREPIGSLNIGGGRMIKSVRNAMISGASSAVVSWILQRYSMEDSIMEHIKSFFITFSPIFIGIIVYIAHRLISYFITLNMWITSNPISKHYDDNSASYESLEQKISLMITKEFERRRLS